MIDAQLVAGFVALALLTILPGADMALVARVPAERVAGGRASMDSVRLRERLGELRLPVLVALGLRLAFERR